jgi:hypothetical protein
MNAGSALMASMKEGFLKKIKDMEENLELRDKE